MNYEIHFKIVCHLFSEKTNRKYIKIGTFKKAGTFHKRKFRPDLKFYCSVIFTYV